jgi:type IV pilus assembly protein PilV
MAKNDLYEWNLAVTTSLPSGAGTIARTANVFTITITWDDDKDGNDTNNIRLQTSFQL